MSAGDQKPIAVAQRAVRQLREMILTGELAPGSDHLEAELADLLGMSRTPIREAALTLEREGLLVMRPRRGIRVVPVSPDDMREIYEILTELESLAAERAAETGYSASDLSTLAEAIEAMDDAIAARDLEAWAIADAAFHSELVRLGGNSRIGLIASMMSNQVCRAKAQTLFIRPLPSRSNEDHRAVYEAILAGDATEARRLHRDHRQHAQKMLSGILEKHRIKQL
ncbi:GntR family transcriptional regulator [Salipiger mangrovisoli]|uniref:GntR family transcriptional regulator n=1 Tax=Salipiger mangrovisoli TaxID=2865933 RepID=A0ABR9XB58_9RHOB|nr:GntR family transcriptional regulator [Salipiger mangrovisoli]MBE9640717.1 GntR family transcriptional regulator [Salipiger mangrovisoli]